MNINPMVKYTLARIGGFVVLAFILNVFLHDAVLSMLISAVVTAIGSYFLLRKWRDEAAAKIETSMDHRRAEKEKLRSALAGDDTRRS